MFSMKHRSGCLNIIKMRFSFADIREFLMFQRSVSSVKYTVKLSPDVEENLISGEMKHRKHPGVRKIPPVQLPPFIVDSIYRLISNDCENAILKETFALGKRLTSRRLPVEMHEVESKIREVTAELDEAGEDIPEIMKKEQLLQLKRQIQIQLGHWKPFDYDHHECLVYLALRAAPNYASAFRVFNEIRNKVPTFQPKTFFDFGSGVGSCVWAANSLWKDSIAEYFCVDSSPEMIDISENILTDENTETKLIKNLSYRQFLPASENIKYDLVVSSFSLLDLSSAKDRLQAVDTLWRKTKDMLVIIEYGNKAGFSSVLDARDYIIHIENGSEKDTDCTSGVHVLCPCPHEFSCPMLKRSLYDPCGLTVTYETIFPRHHILYRKDWISYVVLRKGHRNQDDLNWPRIVKPVLKKSKHVHCSLCCEDGAFHEIIVTKAKHGRHAYRSAKSSNLGDLFPANVKLSTNEVDFPDEQFSQFNEESESDDEQNKT